MTRGRGPRLPGSFVLALSVRPAPLHGCLAGGLSSCLGPLVRSESAVTLGDAVRGSSGFTGDGDGPRFVLGGMQFAFLNVTYIPCMERNEVRALGTSCGVTQPGAPDQGRSRTGKGLPGSWGDQRGHGAHSARLLLEAVGTL